MPDKLTPNTLEQTPDVTPDDVFDLDEYLAELATLSPIAYDQRRGEAAEALGIRVGTLDTEVYTRRPKRNGGTAGNGMTFDDPKPCAEAVDGTELLNDLVATFTRYVILPPGGAELLMLWTLFTYCHDTTMISPILGIISPEKRCGKTTLLTLLRRLIAKPLPGANITPAVV